MAGPVKGTWGGEEIELNDAATETTLLKLLDAMNRMSSGSGGSGAGDAAKSTEELASKAQEAGDQLEEFGDAAEEEAGRLRRGFNVLTAASMDLLGEFLIGGSSISDFTKHITGAVSAIPIFGGALGGVGQLFVNVIQSNINAFRELSNVGVDFGTSLFDIQSAAARSGLSLATFQQTVGQNSETLAKFGGNAAEGARRFQETSRILQKDFGPSFSALGMTMEETAQFTADYMELQTTLGRNQGRDAKSQAQGTAAYIMQLDKLSKVTGKQRDQVADMLQQQAEDARQKALLATLDAEAGEALQNITAIVGSKDPKIADAITELVATGGAPMSEFGRSIATMYPEVARASAALKEGAITEEQYMQVLEGSIASAQNRMKVDGKTIALQQQMGITVNDATVGFASLGKLTTDMTEIQKKQQDQMNKGSKGLLDFERRITEARNIIFGALIESGVFQNLEAGFSTLIDSFTNQEAMDKLKSVVEKVSDAFQVFMADFSRLSIGEMFDKYVITPLKNLIFGEESMSPADVVAKQGEVKTELTTQNTIINDIKGNEEYKSLLAAQEANKELTVEQQKALSSYEDKLKTAQLKVTSLTAEQEKLNEPVKESQGLLGGLMDSFNIPWGKIALGIGGVTLAMMGISAAVSKMAPGLTAASPGLTGLGIAFAGLGVAGAGISMMIDSIAESFGKVAKGIKEFESIDPGTIESVGTGLVPLADVLVDLAQGGIVASFVSEGALENLANGLKAFAEVDHTVLPPLGLAILAIADPITEMAKAGFFANFVSSGALPNLAEGIRSFQGLDVSTLHVLGPALISLQQGIAAFTGEGVLDSLGKAASGFISSITGSGTSPFETLIEGLKGFESLNASALEQIGIGLNGITNFDYDKMVDVADGLELLKMYAETFPEGAYDVLVNSLDQFNNLELDNLYAISDILQNLTKLQLTSLIGEIDIFADKLSELKKSQNLSVEIPDSMFAKVDEVRKKNADMMSKFKTEISDGMSAKVDEARKRYASSVTDIKADFGKVTTSTDSLQGLDTTDLSSYNKEIASVLNEFKNLNIKTETANTDDNVGIPEGLANITGMENNNQDRLDKLNTTMEQILGAISEGNSISGKSYKVAKQKTNSVW